MAHRYGITLTPLGNAGGKALQSATYCVAVVALGTVPALLSVVEQQCVHTNVMRYILWELIHFLLKLVRCWHLVSSENSQLSFSSLLSPSPFFPLLLYVPGLHAALWADYSSDVLITVNEGLKQGNSCLILGY